MINARTAQLMLVVLFNAFLILPPSLLSQGDCSWTTAELLPHDGDSVDKAGTDVGISGDWAILGIPYDDDRAANAGAAYIYRRNGSAWQEFVKIYASDAAAEDRFGYSVGISGNVAIVGAFQNDDLGSNSGSAYIFRYNGSTWVQERKLLAPDGVASDNFGFAVDISGSSAIVGAYGDDDRGTNAGSAYLFQYNGSNWSNGTKVMASDGAAYDYFGLSVALSGQYAVVGADLDDNIASNAGAAYIYRQDTSGWIQDAKLVPSNIVADDHFGISVAIDGDVVVVGADESDAIGPSAGAAFVFRRTMSGWQSEGRLLPSAYGYESFGASVAVSGDRIVVGAPNAKDHSITYPHPDQGAVYVFTYSNGIWLPTQRILAASGWSYDLFGTSVAASGQRFVIGAPGDASNGTDGGLGYIYEGACQFGDVVISSSSPPDGSIDTLEDLDAATGARRGLSQVSLTFSAPVISSSGTPLSVSNFNVKLFRNGSIVNSGLNDGTPQVSLLSGSGAGPYVLRFVPRLPLGVWTQIEAIEVRATTGSGISPLGNKIALGFLPMDIDQNGTVTGADINRWLQVFNDVYNPAPLTKVQLLDQKRDGAIYNNDITRALQLINGVQTFQSWSGFTLGPRP